MILAVVALAILIAVLLPTLLTDERCAS